MADAYDQEMMLGYIEGDLDDAQRSEFERQMARDARLRMLVEQMLEDRRMLRGSGDIEAPESLMDQVNQRLERSMLLGAAGEDVAGVVGSSGRMRIGRWVALSSMAALVVVGVSVAVIGLRGPTLTETVQQQEAQALSGEFEGRELAMADEGADRRVAREKEAPVHFGAAGQGVEAVSGRARGVETERPTKGMGGFDAADSLKGGRSSAVAAVPSAPEAVESTAAGEPGPQEDLWKINIRSFKDSDMQKQAVGSDGRHEELFNEIRKVLTEEEEGAVKPNAALDIEQAVDWPRLTDQEVAVVEQAVAEAQLSVGVGYARQERVYDATLKVAAGDVDAVRERLVQWARGNRVGIQSTIGSYDMDMADGGLVMGNEQTVRRVVLVLEAGQMGELVKYLDSESDKPVVVRSRRGWWNEIVSEQRKADHLWMMQGRVELDGESGEMKQTFADWMTADFGKYLQQQVGDDDTMMLHGERRLLVVEVEVGG